MNCSFIEPPSVVEQPSPSWSSRGSFSSFDTTDEGPVYCVPHEGERRVFGRERSSLSPSQGTAARAERWESWNGGKKMFPSPACG